MTNYTPVHLHALDHAGGQPLIVLMPGLTANAHCFDGLAQAGLSPRFRVLALDLRGRGRSDKPETGYSMAHHAADVVALLDEMGLDQVVLGGHSFGGLLTMYLAAHYPQRVSHVLLLDAAATLHPRTREMIQPSVARLGQVSPSWDAYLNAVKAQPALQGWWNPAVESYYRADVETNSDGSVQARSRPQAITEALEGTLDEPWLDYVGRIYQPALLIRACEGYGPPGTPPIVPLESAWQTVQAMPNGRYEEVAGNHMTMLYGEGARQIVAAITDFLIPTPAPTPHP